MIQLIDGQLPKCQFIGQVCVRVQINHRLDSPYVIIKRVCFFTSVLFLCLIDSKGIHIVGTTNSLLEEWDTSTDWIVDLIHVLLTFRHLTSLKMS